MQATNNSLTWGITIWSNKVYLVVKLDVYECFTSLSRCKSYTII